MFVGSMGSLEWLPVLAPILLWASNAICKKLVCCMLQRYTCTVINEGTLLSQYGLCYFIYDYEIHV